MARLVYQAGKRMREIYNQGLKYTLMYIEGKRYYLRDPRWRDTVSPTDHIYTGISDITFVVTHTQELGLNGGEDHISVGVIPFFNAATPIYPNVINIENDDEFTIRIQFSDPMITDLTTVASSFTVKDTANVPYTVLSSAAGVDASEIVLTMSNFMSASGNMTVTYDGVIPLDVAHEGSLFQVDPFTEVFTPSLVPPQGFASENLSVSLPITFENKRIYQSAMYNAPENISVGIANTTFVVTAINIEIPL